MLAAIVAPTPRIGVPGSPAGSACGAAAGAAARWSPRPAAGRSLSRQTGSGPGSRELAARPGPPRPAQVRSSRRWSPRPARRRPPRGPGRRRGLGGRGSSTCSRRRTPARPPRRSSGPPGTARTSPRPTRSWSRNPSPGRRRAHDSSRVPVAGGPAGPRTAAHLPFPGRSTAHYSHGRGQVPTTMGSPIEQPVDRQDPQRRRRRPQRRRQDDARRSAPRSEPGVVPRAGRVEDGTTVCDTEPEEVKRDDVAVARRRAVRVEGARRRDLQDQPDRHARATPTSPATSTPRSSVADLAVLVVSAVDGIEVGTESAWAPLRRGRHPADGVRQQGGQAARRLPRRARRSSGDASAPASCRSSCRSARRRRCTASPTCSPTRASSTSADGRHHTEPIPADVADEEHRLHDELVEEIVSGDDEQLERYLSGDVPTAAELERTLAHELLAQRRVPGAVRLGAHRRRRRPPRRLHLRARPVARRPSDHGRRRQRRRQRHGRRRRPTRPAKPLAYVFKTVADQFVGQVSLFKVLSGTVAVDERLVSSSSGAEERMHGLFHLRGKDHLADRPDRRRRHRRRRQAGATRRPAPTLAPRDSPVRVAAARAAAARLRAGARAA